jgi:hypothetical protein
MISIDRNFGAPVMLPPHHRPTRNKISKSMAKKITMMASSHNILCSFTSV